MTANQDHSEHSNFEAKAKASLEKSVQQINQQTRHDLANIRQQALNRQVLSKASPKLSWLNMSNLAPAGALSFCLFVAVFFVYNQTNKPDAIRPIAQQASQADQVAILELLTDLEALDTASDPGFYLWMEEALANEGINNAV
jgi:hypothetical protein